ncbi:4-hydroxy-3-methylbut-2-en-1-yl diphosphate synthase, partial [Rhodococcus hoagii]|nr:4-hydroxy-3-methylbut-2-en-1-yl diphosphate synthase [Prescottella equi]
MVGNVGVGSDHPVSVQSMCTPRPTTSMRRCQQIAELTAS